jgi:DNA-binding SARP family transcriptional activator
VGVIYYRGEYGRARETLLQALQAAQQAGSGRWTAYVLAGLGDVERDESHVSEALDHYGKALSLLDEKREGFLSVYIRAAQAELHAAQDEPLRALDLARQALELASSHQSPYEEGLAGIALGLALLEKEPERAVQALEQAAALLQRNGAMREMTRAAFLLSAALYRIGSRDQAAARLGEALTLADKLGYRNALHALSRWAQPLLAHAAQGGLEIADFSAGTARAEPSGAATPADSVRPYFIALQGLGGSRVELDGETLLAKWAKARELIFLLATENQGRGMMRDDIFQALWPNVPSPKAYSNLHTLVYRVRRFVRQDCISFEDNVYRFAPPGGFAYDVADFQRSMAQGQEAKTEEEAIASYQNAIALYQGDFLKDLLAEWSFNLQRAFRDMFLIAIGRVADSYWKAGGTDMAMALAHRWLDEEPDDEAAHRLLMRCFAAQGNIPAVRRQFQQCGQALARDLQVEPDEETRTLYLSLTGESPGH